MVKQDVTNVYFVRLFRIETRQLLDHWLDLHLNEDI